MKIHYSSLLVILFLILHFSASGAEIQVYIVYLGGHNGEKNSQEIEEIHHSYLFKVKGSKEEAKDSIVYSYKNVINGFSAVLSPDEAAKLSEIEGVILVFHSHPRKYSLQTTSSWDFMNIPEGQGDSNHSNSTGTDLLHKAGEGKDIIVGIIDSGVWPESPSFSDEGMGPIPKSWKGICEHGVSFFSSNCNKKLIGARYHLKSFEKHYGRLNDLEDYRSARDRDGHGTHTTSTVGGRRVTNASALGGFAARTARGGAPLARLAIYKVCWPIPGTPLHEGVDTCLPDDMLSAFDNAIADGVQVISFSIASNSTSPLTDATNIGALHAVKRNIVVAFCAGNYGPTTVDNIGPWIITVGASSIDRVFPSPVVLGNGMMIQGQTVTPFMERITHPLVYAGDVELPGRTTNITSGYCSLNTLSPKLVKGKIVLCLQGSVFQALEVKRAGGVAAILGSLFNGSEIAVNADVLPDTVVVTHDTSRILNYIYKPNEPLATLIPGRTLVGGTTLAPVMAPFTSTGPNSIEPNILKPDITAPGFNILAAWSEGSSPTKLPTDNRVVKYNIISGTSMSCPHVAAVAALIKAIHPDWSSAAIRSALMTTARQTNNMGKPITDAEGNIATPFQYGAGHIQPSKAADPGLVYDTSYEDYLLFLCSAVNNSFEPLFKCPKNVPSPSNLNYPSLAISQLNGTATLKRTVTNVGDGKSVYSLNVKAPVGYSVKISPKTLDFKRVGEKKSFNITIVAKTSVMRNEYGFGLYEWSDGVHVVRSPIVVSSA